MKLGSVSAFSIALLIAGALAGGFYVHGMRAELNDARQRFVLANEKAQKLSATLADVEKSRDDALAAQKYLETKAAEGNDMETVSTASASRSTEELDAMRARLSETQSALEYARRISGYWRDLYDYTKPAPVQLKAETRAESIL